jgi:cation transport regulator ChaC
VAYLVESARACEVLADLDRRERAGYERVEVELEFVDPPSGTTRALVYQARSSNPGFVADSSDEDIAEIVGKARGPSGDNASYVRLLSEALRALGEDDPHVSAIARLLAEKS